MITCLAQLLRGNTPGHLCPDNKNVYMKPFDVTFDLMGAEEMYIQTPQRVEEKKTSSVLAKALTILEDTEEKQASMMMMLSFTL